MMVELSRVLILVASLVLSGCALFSRPAFHSGPMTPPVASPPPNEDYTSTLSAHVYGTVSVHGGVSEGGAPYNDVKQSSGPDLTAQAAGATTGDENDISCGGPELHHSSGSVAAATFVPQLDLTTRTYGFGLNLAIHAHGGWWKHHGFLGICTDSSGTSGGASADAVGEVRLTFNGQKGESDRLIVRVSGNTKPTVIVRDINNNVLPLSNLAGGVGQVVDLPEPGPYFVSAAISDQTTAGPDDSFSKTQDLAVSVQSMRDALTLGYGSPVNQEFKIPLPLFATAVDIQTAIKNALFNTPDGKYFPCKSNACDAPHVYLESPEVIISGGWVVIKFHVAGGVGPLGIIGISGDVTLYGVPASDGDVIAFPGLAVETQSHSWLFSLAQSAGLEQKLLDSLRSQASFDTKPLLDKALAEVQSHFPVKWGGVCLLADPTSLALNGIYTKPESNALEALFFLGLKIGDSTTCKVTGIQATMNALQAKVKVKGK